MPLYPGQQARLTEKISWKHDLLQETEGTVLHVVPDPLEDQDTPTLIQGRLIRFAGEIENFSLQEDMADDFREQNILFFNNLLHFS